MSKGEKALTAGSLCDFKKRLEDSKIPVVSFDGIRIITKHGTWSIAVEQVYLNNVAMTQADFESFSGKKK